MVDVNEHYNKSEVGIYKVTKPKNLYSSAPSADSDAAIKEAKLTFTEVCIYNINQIKLSNARDVRIVLKRGIQTRQKFTGRCAA